LLAILCTTNVVFSVSGCRILFDQVERLGECVQLMGTEVKP